MQKIIPTKNQIKHVKFWVNTLKLHTFNSSRCLLHLHCIVQVLQNTNEKLILQA
jgi:hypothetical protein